jgi:aspartate/glutamate racemase
MDATGTTTPDARCVPPSTPRQAMKTIGLLGGLSWVSTIDYYRHLNEGVNARLGGLDFARCVISSLNFGDIQRRGWAPASI